jgi:hypothetical protein
MLFRLHCCLFSSFYQRWQGKLTLYSKIQTCFLWYFGTHNLTDLDFHHYKPRIEFLFFCNYGTLNYIQVIIYFLIMFPLSHMFW